LHLASRSFPKVALEDIDKERENDVLATNCGQ